MPSDLGKNPDFLASKNLVSFAIEQGWYRPADGQPFNVVKAYCAEPRESSAPEVRHVLEAVNAAAPKVEAPVLMKALHDMGRDSSGYGQVADLRANVNPDLRTLWVAPGPPITAAFVPWRLGAETAPPEYRMHRYLTAGEAERTIDSAQQGVEGTRYADGTVKRLLYLVNEHRDLFLPEVNTALQAFEGREYAAQPEVERTAKTLLNAHEDALAHRYLTEQAQAAAAGGLQLMEALADGIEARTKVLYGIRMPEDIVP